MFNYYMIFEKSFLTFTNQSEQFFHKGVSKLSVKHLDFKAERCIFKLDVVQT